MPRQKRSSLKSDARAVIEGSYGSHPNRDIHDILDDMMDSSMMQKDEFNNVEVITSSDDLPAASGGFHPLADSTVYIFNGFVTSSNGLELGSPSPLIGRHGAVDGFIYTGGGTAIKGSNAGFFQRNMYTHAPGGTLFDLTGTTSTEMLVESCSYSDAAGLGNISDLGTIDGFRVPTFKGTNWEEFDSGLTITGTSEKVFVSGCPLRNLSGSGVTILHFDSSFESDIVDIVDCYIKSVQSDTVVVDVDASATVNEVFQYRGTTHDNTVTKSNILTGSAGVEEIGYKVSASYPLRDSNVGGSLDLDSSYTATGSGAGAVELAGTSTISIEERMSKSSDGVLQYDGKPDRDVVAHATITVSGANTAYEVGLVKNGLPAAGRTEVGNATKNSSDPSTISTTAKLSVATGDKISMSLENTGGTTDLTVENYSLTIIA